MNLLGIIILGLFIYAVYFLMRKPRIRESESIIPAEKKYNDVRMQESTNEFRRKISGSSLKTLFGGIILFGFLYMCTDLFKSKVDTRTKEELSTAADDECWRNLNRPGAIELYRKAIAKEINDSTFDARMYAEIAYQYYRLDDYNNCIKENNIALSLDRTVIKNNYYYIQALEASYSKLGVSLYDQKKYDDAINYLNKSIEIDSTSWYSYSILARIYSDLGDKKREIECKKLEEKYYQISVGRSDYSSSSSKQSNFKDWLFRNTAVTEVHFESNWQIWVTLESYKYTSESDVKEIAKTIARWYAQKMSISRAACTIWYGDQIYAKGYYGM